MAGADNLLDWVTFHEKLLSGLAALVVLGGVVVSPAGHGLRAFLARRRGAQKGPAGSPLRPPGSAHAPPLVKDRPSIAVLPFQNMSGDPDDAYFAEGIAEDIITALSCYPDLFVIARNSSFTYRNRTVLVNEVGRELGVQYVVEGSVRRAGGRARITARLSDAATGKQLWAQNYDRDLEDLFSVQDEVVRGVVAVLPSRVEAALLDRASHKKTASLDAYDHLLRGKYLHHIETPEANREAQACFDRAAKADPHFAAAYAWKACALGQARTHQFELSTPERLAEMNRLLETATRLDANNTECHRIMSRLALAQRQFEKSEHHLDIALKLNPNDPRLVVQRGVNLTFMGDPEEAIPWIERAMRLDPFSADRYALDLARALFMAQRPHDAAAVLERTWRNDYEHYVWLAAALAASSDTAKAQEACRQALAIRPGLSIGACFDQGFPWKRAEDEDRLRSALRLAGMPE
jgi:adenylate cyclase